MKDSGDAHDEHKHGADASVGPSGVSEVDPQKHHCDVCYNVCPGG